MKVNYFVGKSVLPEGHFLMGKVRLIQEKDPKRSTNIVLCPW